MIRTGVGGGRHRSGEMAGSGLAKPNRNRQTKSLGASQPRPPPQLPGLPIPAQLRTLSQQPLTLFLLSMFSRKDQGSSFLATLGFGSESRWASQIAAWKMWVMLRSSRRSPKARAPRFNGAGMGKNVD